ncbi:MAG: hypothetical protein CSB13_10135 [Chloroflexi bacterium]|nr:MAG: hypothetical protein CSB13_10135 [Chloroflexota bacterium]
MSKKRVILLIGSLLILLCGAGLLGLTLAPNVAAQGASMLRSVLGNAAVGQLETIYFTLQDNVRQVQYDSGLAEAEAPWEMPTLPATSVAPTAVPPPPPTPTRQPTHEPTNTHTATPPPTAVPSPMPSPTPDQWTLPPATPFGELEGAGIWQPYLTNQAGAVVALRTFLQPDKERPYALAAVVAFDLNQIDLKYVLGSEEPALPGGPRGIGYMDADDKDSGNVLATFNGGFMGTHGAYGAMADGLVALPAKDGYATITIAEDSSIAIGEWGNDITADGGPYTSWRQNARLITHNGTINERVYNGSAATWGSSIEGDVVTWRSALGIDEARQVLYFVAGPSLSMPALAEVLTAVHAHNSLLLDINESWVHFAAIHYRDGQPIPEPLLAKGMNTTIDRYLRQSARDFFYVIAK